VSEVDEQQVDVRWGMGDAVLGIVASIVLSNLGVVVALGVTGNETLDDLSIVALALLNIPLWLGLLGAVRNASRRKGLGSLRDDFGFAMRPADVPVGLAAGFALQLVTIAVTYPVYRLLGIDTDQVGKTAENLADRAVSAPQVAVLVVMVVLIAPVVEELFYRGLVLRSMERRWGTAVAVGASSLLFASLHFQWFDLLPLTLAGLAFALMRVRSGRLGPAIWTHVGFNLVAVISLVASSS